MKYRWSHNILITFRISRLWRDSSACAEVTGITSTPVLLLIKVEKPQFFLNSL